MESSNKYGTRKPTSRPEKLSTQILKSLVNAPCSTRTIRRHLNNEKIKHKRIHHPGLIMKHKEKRLEYVRPYQTMSAQEQQKVVFLDKNSV